MVPLHNYIYHLIAHWSFVSSLLKHIPSIGEIAKREKNTVDPVDWLNSRLRKEYISHIISCDKGHII